jgi:hypothetical protein
MEALAKGGAKLLPFLKELSAEGGRQVILTQQMIEQADAYSDSPGALTRQARRCTPRRLPPRRSRR